MKRTLRSLLTTLAVGLLVLSAKAHARPSGEDAALMLRLRDGSIQWGSIQSHDPDGLTFVLLANGGVVRLPWSLLHPEEEQELRLKFGYVDLTGDEVMIDADRIVTSDGVELIGRIVDRTADAILLKTSVTTIPVPKSRVVSATTVQVPALEVFTKDELYNQQISAGAPMSAEANFRLAQFCERIFDFAHAVEHYKKAAELDPSFRADDLKLAIPRAIEKAKQQDQIDYLALIDLLMARKKFDEALARADAFKEKFPDSPLLAEARKKHDRVIKARDRYVADRVATKWHFWAGRLARQAGIKMTLEQSLGYLDEQMKKEIVENVAKETLKISKEATVDVVRAMWKNRKKVHWYRASYGNGTWLLGKDGALKGEEPDKDKKDEKEKGEKDKARADFEQKLARFLQNQEVARKAQSQDEKKDDREGFWKEFPSAQRAGWILAYYAENAGDMEVGAKPLFSNCKECGGKGTREISLAGANVSRTAAGKGNVDQVVECETCHGLGRVRRILYR